MSWVSLFRCALDSVVWYGRTGGLFAGRRLRRNDKGVGGEGAKGVIGSRGLDRVVSSAADGAKEGE